MRSINPTLKLSMDRSNKASSSSSNTVITNITLSRSPSENELKTNKDDDKVEANPYANIEDLGGKTRDVRLNDTTDNMTDKDKDDTIKFLNYLVEAYRSNPLKYNDYLVCSESLLCDLITTLTGADEVSIVLSELDESCGCTGKNKPHIVLISKIWVRFADDVQLFKYKCSSYLQIFEKYGISLKFIYSTA